MSQSRSFPPLNNFNARKWSVIWHEETPFRKMQQSAYPPTRTTRLDVRPARYAMPSVDEFREEATFSSLVSQSHPLVDIDTIEREVDALLADPLSAAVSPSAGTKTPQNQDDDIELTGFLSHQPQYQRSIVAKKLQLYEKKIQLREKQIEMLTAMHAKAVATVKTLQGTIDRQQKAFDAEHDEWEEEKASLLRYRGGGAGDKSSAMAFQMNLGMSAVAMAARSRKLNDTETEQQRELRMKMLNGAMELQDQLDTTGADDLASYASRSASKLLWLKMRRFVVKHLYPFATDIRQIEARFGYSVASYFRFFRWIIMAFMVISIPSLVALTLHILLLVAQNDSTRVDWTRFAGTAPSILLLPKYREEEGLLYSVVLVTMEVVLLVLTVQKWITEDRQAKTVEAIDGGGNKPRFGRIVLNAWDFGATTHDQVMDLKKSIAEQVKITLAEEQMAERVRRRTRKERYQLYTRRLVAFIIYVVIQAASWYAIIAVTTQSSELQRHIATQAAFLAPYVASLVPALVTVINGIVPTVISLLTALERWDDVGFAIKALVTRLYLAKVLNVLIQLVSFALLLDPYLLTSRQSSMGFFTIDGSSVRKNVMLAFKPDSYTCRAEQVGSGLVNLVITDFAIGKVAAIATPAVIIAIKGLGTLWARLRDRRRARSLTTVMPISEANSPVDTFEPNRGYPPSSVPGNAAPLSPPPPQNPTKRVSLSQLHTKSEFQVPQKMVALLYSCTIGLVAIPLAPSASILSLLLHVINFKFDKAYLMRTQKKPTTPWDAKDAGSFFVKFFFCTVSLFVLFTHFFLSNTRLPKTCEYQDVYLMPHDERICVEGTYSDASKQCQLNTTRSKSLYFTGPECSSGYPRCVCASTLACGPFINSTSGYTMLLAAIKKVNAISAVYELLVANALVAWGVVVVFVMGSFFIRNSLRVHLMISRAREHEVALSMGTLRKKIKQLESKLRVHRMASNSTKD